MQLKLSLQKVYICIRVPGVFRIIISSIWLSLYCSLIYSIRFMLGGEHGRLKYGPPEGHSPVCESLLPKDVLTIQPCFQFGDLPRGIITGPQQITKNAAFVPHPVDTAHVSINYFAPNNIDQALNCCITTWVHKQDW